MSTDTSVFVVNVKDKKPFDVYVGRETKVFERSKFANPFSDLFNSPEVCMIKFDKYFWSTPALYGSIKELRGKVLADWLPPAPSHAYYLAELANMNDEDLEKEIKENVERVRQILDKEMQEQEKEWEEKWMETEAKRRKRGYKATTPPSGVMTRSASSKFKELNHWFSPNPWAGSDTASGATARPSSYPPAWEKLFNKNAYTAPEPPQAQTILDLLDMAPDPPQNDPEEDENDPKEDEDTQDECIITKVIPPQKPTFEIDGPAFASVSKSRAECGYVADDESDDE